MDKKYKDEFSCLGTFIAGEDEASFKSALKTAINQSIKPSKIVLELMDEAGKPIETDLPVAFFNNFTGHTVEEIIHFLVEYIKTMGNYGNTFHVLAINTFLFRFILKWNIIIADFAKTYKISWNERGSYSNITLYG